MIERIVMIKLKDERADDAGREEVAARSREVLPALPGVRGVEVALPADPSTTRQWDLCLKVRFDRIEDIPAYADDPAHRSFVDEFLKPRMVVIKAWNLRVV
jgi:hypothetical protein